MTLLERIHAAESCKVKDCQRARLTDAVVCREHLNDLWANKLDQTPSGEYVERRQFLARIEAPA